MFLGKDYFLVPQIYLTIKLMFQIIYLVYILFRFLQAKVLLQKSSLRNNSEYLLLFYMLLQIYI